MKVSFIRHGMTAANEKRLYCGHTNLPLSEKGRQGLAALKKAIAYPTGDIYLSSGLARTDETMAILYGRPPDVTMAEFMEMNFGAFEMKSYEDLKDKPEYQRWIGDINGVSCPRGESGDIFHGRVREGLRGLSLLKAESAVVVCHGGVIVSVMDRLFPGEKNFYEWQPDFGRGYTLDLFNEKAALIAAI